jgi:hypothetical protein
MICTSSFTVNIMTTYALYADNSRMGKTSNAILLAALASSTLINDANGALLQSRRGRLLAHDTHTAAAPLPQEMAIIDPYEEYVVDSAAPAPVMVG